jgi:hypothetical protein
MARQPASGLGGLEGIPEPLLRLMVENGINPRARFVESAEGWRLGDPEIDLSDPEEEAETLALTRAAVEWLSAQLRAAEDSLDPAASVLELDRPDWLD